MGYCENCGRPVPEGQLLCADCAAETGRQPRAKKGRPAVIILAVLVALAAVFFILAVLLGGKARPVSASGKTLNAWQGEALQPGDPGPEELTIDAPYAQSLRDNPKPEEPAGGHRYELIVADVNWQEACDRAAAAGGHLATITSEEEYMELCQLANQVVTQLELRYLWLGAQVGENGWGDDSWITGEPWTFDVWYPGEPSGVGSDGALESVLCMWRVGDGGWTFNDQNPALVSDYTAGKIGYVIEYEE